MAQRYGQLKTMKTAKIGTIMPWAGDGNDGNLASNIPRGWELCDGAVWPASRYPLFTSIIGNSYGGSEVGGTFPHYTGTVKVPNLVGRVMMDLEPSMLFDSRYYAGQQDAYNQLVDSAGQSLVVEDGLSKSIPTLISADTNIVFTIPSDIVFVGKITGGTGETNITITPPTFTTTVYTIGRKLSIGHTPSHNHPGDYTSATGGGPGPELFEPSTFTVGGSQSGAAGCPSISWLRAERPADHARWCSGTGFVTYYDDTTLIQTSEFSEFISTAQNDYSQIPPSTTADYVYEGLSPFTDTFTAKAKTTHAMKAWTGYFPRPIEMFGTRNYFGYNTGTGGAPYIGPTAISDDPENRPAFSTSVQLVSQATKFVVSGDIGTDETKIRPFMLVKTSDLSGTYLEPGTQVVGITRLGTSNYTYEVELSKNIGGTGSQTRTVTFRDGTYPTTLSNTPSTQDPSLATLRPHDHGTFELSMGDGLKGPTTHPVNDVSKGDLLAETLTGALNITANIANPSQNIVYIIRVF